MTLTAPKSRQGKFVLVLAFLAAAVVAVLGALFWSTTAQADISSVTATVDDDVGATVTQGDIIEYTYVIDVTGAVGGTTTNTILSANHDDDLEGFFAVSGTGTWSTGECSNGGGNVVTCTDATGPIVDSTVVLRYRADGATISPPSCSVSDDGVGSATCTVTPGTVTVNPGVTVTDATNFPGIGHTFIFNLAKWITCQSDGPPGTNDDEVVQCVAGDVTVGGTAGCVVTSGPTVTVGSTATPSFVSVTIDGGNGTEGTCTVALDTYYVASSESDPSADFDIAPVTATKTFAAAGELRHHDAVDAASEDEKGDTDAYCSTWGLPCGLLSAQHDGDDATGSFHEACIIGSTLTHSANAGIITWNITTVAGTPTVSPTPPTEFGGPNDEPCVRWGSNSTGTQQITASVDADGAGPNPEIVLYWDNETNAPLIKEWNDLDATLIINVTGNVGDTLAANTLELDDWAARDCTLAGFCARADWDGSTLTKTGVVILGPVSKGLIDAAGASFIDYTMGSHSSGPSDEYAGPIDGAAQEYSVTGVCGSVRLEDPTTGDVIIALPGDHPHVLSSDKGVGFQFVPNSVGAIETTPANADCLPGAEICVSISTSEDMDFGSPPLDTVPDESVCVRFEGGEVGNKHPDLAWAGQRKSLDVDWSVEEIVGGVTVRTCPWGPAEGTFIVRYVQHAGSPGALTDDLGAFPVNTNGQDFMEVTVFVDPISGDPNSDCKSAVLYEAEGEGQVDVSAFVVFEFNGDVISDEVDFLIFYMKFFDIVMTPDDAQDVNVSEGTEVMATVRGWTVTNSSNCAQLPAGPDDLPAGRCVFPDDWVYLATGQRGEDSVPVATVDRPEWDLHGGSSAASCTTAAGPLSQLDSDGCGTGMAPHVTAAQRDTIFADGFITPDDASMPVALVKFELVGSNGVVCATNPTTAVLGCSGFITTVDSSEAQFDATHVPAEAWIPPTTGGLPPQGYSWNTWGPAGQPQTGLYDFWTDLAQSGDEVISCGGENPCTDGVATGGYKWIGVYSDNHGVAKATVFGDADLTFDDCASSGPIAAADIVFIDGVFCDPGDEVGSASVVARADYPDKRKHPQVRTDEVDYTFTWGGIKEVTIVKGLTDQFNYVVFHVTDRDGFCGSRPDTHINLHPVLGEHVDFIIESSEGIIFPDADGLAAAQLGSWDSKTAHTSTFDTDITSNPTKTVVVEDECQAWVHISSSLIAEVDVIIQAHDPEGTVTFDVIINPFIPPTASPEPTPFTLGLIWGDTDCRGSVMTRDSQAILKYVLDQPPLSQDQPCLEIGEAMTVVGKDGGKWGDWDCNGTVTTRDSQALLRFVLGQSALSQTGNCAAIGDAVNIQPLVP